MQGAKKVPVCDAAVQMEGMNVEEETGDFFTQNLLSCRQLLRDMKVVVYNHVCNTKYGTYIHT